jgi:hypothetical protein
MKVVLLFLLMMFMLLLPLKAKAPKNRPVSISCNSAIVLMDIIKNDNVVWQKLEDHLLKELRKDFIVNCNETQVS